MFSMTIYSHFLHKPELRSPFLPGGEIGVPNT